MNKIVEENAIVEGRADQSYWNVAHSTVIEGFATDISVNAGSRVDFRINVSDDPGSDYKVEIFRLGYYGGSGAREVAEWTNGNATIQPEALFDATRGLVDAGNWSVTDSWAVPADAVSGVYLARVQRLDVDGNPIAGATNQIPFVVRNDGESHDIVLQTSDTTWQAYNGWGGNNGQVGANLYGDPSGRVNWDPIEGAGPHSQDRAYAVSYNRPIITENGQSAASGPQDYIFGADYAAIHWLEKNGYDVAYVSGVDTDRLGADYLKNYKAFISVGHDEYWSGDQRANVTEARDAGVNLLFWSGNEMYWKTRWDVSISADGREYRTLVCYKETLAVADPNAGPEDYVNLDPSDIWTGTWRDVRFHGNPLSGGGNPEDVDPITGLCAYCHCGENALIGQLFGPDGTGQFGGALDVPAEYAALRVWRDTTVANGGKLDMAPGILGYEWDTSPDDMLRPAGLVKLSGTTIPWDGILVDQGNTVAPGIATHNLSLYRAESGALVFGAGTTFWSWGLSDMHASSPYGAQIENVDLQQFTVNMFADMGIQPGVADAVLISQGLTRATASSDAVAATADIAALPAHIAALSSVTITGTATDDDGNPLTVDGKVAVVEVSVDGGLTWRVAETSDGWAHWSFNWAPPVEGTYTVLARAIDDSLNIRTIVADQATVTVARPDAYNFFAGAAPKSTTANLYNDNTTVELGMRFTVDRAGTVSELKYWRSSLDAGDTDVREGHLWRADGTLLGTVTFTGTAGMMGWQSGALSTPIALSAGVEYIVSYVTRDNYISTGSFFTADREVAFDGLDNDSFWGPYGIIRSPQDGQGGGNGVYSYTGGMPVSSYAGSNYWVDLTFRPAGVSGNQAPTITSPATFSLAENHGAVATITAEDADGNAIAYAIAGGADAGRFTIDARTGLLSFVRTPNFELPLDADGDNFYRVTVSASDGVAAAVTKDLAVTVTDVDEATFQGHVFAAGDAPAAVETGDPTDYELGMRFQSNAAGWISELRYFRGAVDAGDTDVRTLNLWTATGQRIGQVAVTSAAGESGWQVGTLTTPMAIQANTTYIVSYGTTDNYAYTSAWFATAHASSDGVLSGLTGNNGVFAAGGTGLFPTTTWNATNYWVDVTFLHTLGRAPAFAGAAAFSAVESQTLAGTVAATDPDGDTLSYAIAGGTDAGLFTLDATTGVLRFSSAPDYEAPADAGANNVYNLVVSVSDGVFAAVERAITVTVTDVAENRVPTVDEITAPATNEDAAPVQINLLAGASDLDGDTLSVAGPVTVTSSNSARTVAYTLAGGLLTLDPSQFGALAAGQSETLQIAYRISDGIAPAVANTATIVVEGRDEALTLTGTSAANTLTGAGNNDLIRGLGGNDTLRGLGGSDTLDGGAGTDSVSGGDGNDVILVRGSEAQFDIIAGDGGIDTLRIDAAADIILQGTTRLSGIEALDAGGFAVRDTNASSVLDLSGYTAITGLAGVLGLGGNDTLIGSAFADTLDGGVGNDSLNGGGGDDTFVIRSTEGQADTIAGGAGLDRILVDASGGDAIISLTTRISGVEAINGSGVALAGTTAANMLDFTGMALTNVTAILGLDGNDTLAGGTGNDVLTSGLGNDTFVFQRSATIGNDRITDFDVLSNDLIRLVGFGTTFAAVAAATTYDAQGALVDLGDLGGDGTIRLSGVASPSFTSEDFILA